MRKLFPALGSAGASRLLSLAAAMGMLGWAYWPNLQTLWIVWSREPNYSHGFLVIPIALLIFWQRLKDANANWSASRGPWWSWLALAAILVARALAYEWNSQWVENATIVPAAACLMLTLGGWPLLAIGWPAAFFLIFMLPLPPLLNNMLSLPLQRIATLGSVFFMQLTGLLALPEGNIIYLPHAPLSTRTLEVAQACNGLSMLMTLAATVTATMFLLPLANWKRIVVLASALPIALLSNVIRIVATGHCYTLIVGEGARKIAHDWSGFLMMPLALVLVCIELLVLSWLAAGGESNVVGPERPVLAVFPAVKDKKAKKDKYPIDE